MQITPSWFVMDKILTKFSMHLLIIIFSYSFYNLPFRVIGASPALLFIFGYCIPFWFTTMKMKLPAEFHGSHDGHEQKLRLRSQMLVGEYYKRQGNTLCARYCFGNLIEQTPDLTF